MKMKKILCVILAIALLPVFGGVFAVQSDGESVDRISVILDGERLEFDVEPIIIDNRTLVPFRAIFEALGFEVEWVESEAQIAEINIMLSISDNAEVFDWVFDRPAVGAGNDFGMIGLQIGSSAMLIGSDFAYSPYYNFRWITLDVPPQIVDNRTLVPLRAIAEATGADVEWDADTQTVTITTNYVAWYDDTQTVTITTN
ncbi:MAG: copper amine oxidase N-terminal domain-containing protein [Oscillospiraceae bacterium]|nr:copper amine oxidase N-terminal domain-containing protein [Oscillospiraceae bacterium]